MHCFVWWGCAWVRLVPHLELWDACIYAGPAVFCEGVEKKFSQIGVKMLMVSANVKRVQKVHCLVWWGCAWVRLVPHWNCGMHAYMLVRHFFVKGVEKKGPNRCKSAYGECECKMSAKSALFSMVKMCLGSTGTTRGILGCIYICWSGTFL